MAEQHLPEGARLTVGAGHLFTGIPAEARQYRLDNTRIILGKDRKRITRLVAQAGAYE
jgi:hypothetical protein